MSKWRNSEYEVKLAFSAIAAGIVLLFWAINGGYWSEFNSSDRNAPTFGSVERQSGGVRLKFKSSIVWKDIGSNRLPLITGDSIFTNDNGQAKLNLGKTSSIEVQSNSLIVISKAQNDLNSTQPVFQVKKGNIKIKLAKGDTAIKLSIKGETYELKSTEKDANVQVNVLSNTSADSVSFESDSPDSVKISKFDFNNPNQITAVVAEEIKEESQATPNEPLADKKEEPFPKFELSKAPILRELASTNSDLVIPESSENFNPDDLGSDELKSKFTIMTSFKPNYVSVDQSLSTLNGNFKAVGLSLQNLALDVFYRLTFGLSIGAGVDYRALQTSRSTAGPYTYLASSKTSFLPQLTVSYPWALNENNSLSFKSGLRLESQYVLTRKSTTELVFDEIKSPVFHLGAGYRYALPKKNNQYVHLVFDYFKNISSSVSSLYWKSYQKGKIGASYEFGLFKGTNLLLGAGVAVIDSQYIAGSDNWKQKAYQYTGIAGFVIPLGAPKQSPSVTENLKSTPDRNPSSNGIFKIKHREKTE